MNKSYKNIKRNYFDLYPNDVLEKLEFNRVIKIIEGYCQSPLGKQLLAKAQFQTDIGLIDRLLTQVAEFKETLLLEEDSICDKPFMDIGKSLDILKVENTVLDEQQIFKIFKVIQASDEILFFFKKNDGEYAELYPELFKLTQKIEIEVAVINAIKEVLDDAGKIRSTASKELQSIRKLISSKYQELDSKFKHIIREFKQNGWLTDDVESVREGRRVLSVSAQHKRRINGIIIGESASGSISFIEPAETLYINNEIFALQQEEKREIYRILQMLSAKIRPYHAQLIAQQRLLGQFDFIRAKAQFALSIDACKPLLVKQKLVEINDGYHPLLLLWNKKLGKKTIPLSLRLSNAGRILVISGPNAGGKSVSLKTIGLLQIMLQTGILIPVDESSQFGVFNKIYVDIGDEQSLENDLSTYSSHLTNMKYFIDFADAKTLILIDEFGSGTDPKFGGAIAESVLEKLVEKFAFGVITTHYSNLKIMATNTDGILNGTLLFDVKNLSPKYQLEVGRPGSSFAFEIAQKIGINEAVLNAAKQKVGDDYKEFDELLSSLQNEKLEIEERDAALKANEAKTERLIEEYERKLKQFKKKQKEEILKTRQKMLDEASEARKKLEQLIADSKKEKENTEKIQQIKKAVADKQKDNAIAIEELKDEIFEKKTDEALKVGSNVQLREGSQTGVVVELRKNNAVVEFGALRTNIKIKELKVVKVDKPKKTAAYKFDSLEAAVSFKNTLDVRGMRRDEALGAVEQFLDQALIANADLLKILHGKGDGILKNSIRGYFKKLKVVKTVSSEAPEYGGDGISIIELN